MIFQFSQANYWWPLCSSLLSSSIVYVSAMGQKHLPILQYSVTMFGSVVWSWFLFQTYFGIMHSVFHCAKRFLLYGFVTCIYVMNFAYGWCMWDTQVIFFLLCAYVMNLAYGLHAHEQKQACVHTPKKDILKKFCVYK